MRKQIIHLSLDLNLLCKKSTFKIYDLTRFALVKLLKTAEECQKLPKTFESKTFVRKLLWVLMTALIEYPRLLKNAHQCLPKTAHK